MWKDSSKQHAVGLIAIAIAGASTAARGYELDPEQKLQAPVPAELDFFGRDVAMVGDDLLICAPGDDDLGSGAGSVHFFENTAAGWQFSSELHASDGGAGDIFGRSVVMQAERAVIGAMHANSVTIDAGAAYVFTKLGGQWQEQQKLSASIGGMYDDFGSAVVLDGDTIVVGAPAGASASGQGYVVVYAYDNQLQSWQEDVILGINLPPDTSYGRSLSLDGERLAVGAPFDSSSGSTAGTVHIYKRSVAGWQLEQSITSLDVATGDAFGWSVALEGDRLAVGAFTKDTAGHDSGALYIFERTAGLWSQTTRIVPEDLATNDQFGSALALDGDRLCCSAPGSAPLGFTTGKVYLYELVYGSWQLQNMLLAAGPQASDGFGNALAFDGEDLIACAVGDDSGGTNSGAAYAMRVRHSVGVPICWGDGLFAPCPCANDSPAIGMRGCLNSTAAGARLSSEGSDSVAQDDLLFHACELPPWQPVALVMSRITTSPLPFGNGIGCLGPDTSSLGIYPGSASGNEQWGPALGASAAFLSGQTRIFQAFYRDAVVNPCTASFNTTGAIRIEFRP